MNAAKYYLFIFLLIITCSYAQNDTIIGKVIDSDLFEIPGVQIFSNGDNLIATTDLNGNFIIKNIENINSLKFSYLATDDEIVEINKNCKYIQLIMFYNATHCFVSLKKLKRIEKREQRAKKKIIPKLLEQAISKKIFDVDKMCNQQKI